MPTSQTIRVELGRRTYDVTVGAGVLEQAGPMLAPLLAGARAAAGVVVITDSNVGPLYARAAIASLKAAGLAADVIDFPAGEQHKDIGTYASVMDRLLGLSPPIDRRSLIVALGGGVVGDLAGFVAATALRGLDWAGVPTTLLADVDAAVGGKTGLDAPAGKNLIGAFHQPRAVLIDAAVLRTLPRGELGNGLAECVKHAVIRDANLLEFIQQNARRILSAEPDCLSELIARNVAIKAAVVAADERESDQRAHLNFGHTLGHAIEAAAGYGAVSHGQAVALGMVAALHIAAARTLIAAGEAQRVGEILSMLSLPARFADLPELPAPCRQPARLREIMLHDKKARGGVVRFVLPTALGSVAIFDDVTGDEIDRAVAALRR